MPKKLFIFTILFMLLALSAFSYYFYTSHSLESRNSNTTHKTVPKVLDYKFSK